MWGRGINLRALRGRDSGETTRRGKTIECAAQLERRKNGNDKGGGGGNRGLMIGGVKGGVQRKEFLTKRGERMAASQTKEKDNQRNWPDRDTCGNNERER